MHTLFGYIKVIVGYISPFAVRPLLLWEINFWREYLEVKLTQQEAFNLNSFPLPPIPNLVIAKFDDALKNLWLPV